MYGDDERAFDAWKLELARDQNVLARIEKEPLERILEKMASFSELAGRLEARDDIRGRFSRGRLSFGDLADLDSLESF